MMDWVKIASTADYFPNTPSNLAVWMSQLMCEHMLSVGGLDHFEDKAARKSSLFYNFIDDSRARALEASKVRESRQLMFVNDVDPRLRSRMNIPFVLDSIGA